MQGRTWSLSLRGIKIGVFALSIFAASFGSSVVISRPASAEGFLQKTVQCALGALVWYDCRSTPVPETTAQPTSPAPTSTPPETTASTSTTPSNGASSQNATSSAQPSGTTAPPQVPIEAQEVNAAASMPDLPYAAHRNSRPYDPVAYTTYRYSNLQAGQSDTMQPIPIQATAEGWRVFGIGWYWWLMVTAAIIGIIMVTKRVKYKQYLSIVK